MRQTIPLVFCCALLGAGSASAQVSDDRNVSPVVANQQAAEIARGDPARWYRDDATRAARMRTLQKEIGAALQEAQNACRRQPKAERAGCLAAARATWRQDLAAGREQVDASPGN